MKIIKYEFKFIICNFLISGIKNIENLQNRWIDIQTLYICLILIQILIPHSFLSLLLLHENQYSITSLHYLLFIHFPSFLFLVQQVNSNLSPLLLIQTHWKLRQPLISGYFQYYSCQLVKKSQQKVHEKLIEELSSF